MTWREPLSATCWAATEATRVIPVEAESPPDSVFLATHTSIPLFQRDLVTQASRITKTNENALLEAVLTQPEDQPILPILGRSGTGKSHLVRWLRARLPETDNRRVIFVPKHRMSLRGILDLILDRATSDRATELRQKVALAVEGISDVQEAKLRLRNELAVLVETRGTRTDVPTEEQELREWLASSEGLPALLSDPVFRDRIFDDQGPIGRLAREKLTGKGNEDKEEAFGFSADDLMMNMDDTSRASAAAFATACALASDRGPREIAAKMLNEQLNPAVSQVFGIGGDDLKELLVEVRVDLQRQGLELLLLIEDFSIFQGIQGGLLDAITLIPTLDNGVCPMRVVMAVTSGYFVQQMPDTVYTRVYRVFDLDDPSPRVTFRPEEVASRYLNAIRVGTGALEQAHQQSQDIPNACEQCPVNDACHRAFGEVAGYGLYPFNKNALARAVKSQLVDDRLSVRDFLTRILRPVLFNQHDEIDNATFPNSAFNDAFRAGAEGILDSVEDEHRLATPGDPEVSKRRVVLVRFWGDEGSGPHNVRRTIHEAFGIPPIEGLRFQGQGARADVDPKPVAPESPESLPTPPTADHSSAKVQLPQLVQAIDNWRARDEMLQSVRNELRGVVHAAVISRLLLEDGLGGNPMWNKSGKQWDGAFDASASIVIGDRPSASTLIAVNRDNDADVRVLRALAWAHATGSWRSVDNGEVLQRVVEERVTLWASDVSGALCPDRDKREDAELVVAAHTLLSMSKALGIPDAFKDDSLSRTRALFAVAPSAGPIASRPMLYKWQKGVTSDTQRLTREQLRLRVLRLASFTQGTGDPLALDLPRITKALRGKGPADTLPVAPGLLHDTAIAVRARTNTLEEVREEAVGLVPDLRDLGGELTDIVKLLDALLAERAAAGQSGTISRADLAVAGRAIKQGDQNRVQATREKLVGFAGLPTEDRLRVLTDDWDDAAERVRKWLTLATSAVAALEQRLGSGPSTAAQLEYEQSRAALLSTLDTTGTYLSDTGESERAS